MPGIQKSVSKRKKLVTCKGRSRLTDHWEEHHMVTPQTTTRIYSWSTAKVAFNCLGLGLLTGKVKFAVGQEHWLSRSEQSRGEGNPTPGREDRRTEAAQWTWTRSVCQKDAPAVVWRMTEPGVWEDADWARAPAAFPWETKGPTQVSGRKCYINPNKNGKKYHTTQRMACLTPQIIGHLVIKSMTYTWGKACFYHFLHLCICLGSPIQHPSTGTPCQLCYGNAQALAIGSLIPEQWFWKDEQLAYLWIYALLLLWKIGWFIYFIQKCSWALVVF